MSNPKNSSHRLLTIASGFSIAASMFLASCYTSQRPSPSVSMGSNGRASESHRPGLGTQAGYEHHSSVNRTQFYRKSASPDAIASFHYNDEDGAKAMADLLGNASRRTGLIELAGGRVRAGLVSHGDDAFPYMDAKTRQIFIGHPGNNYQIRIENRTPHRQEIIVSVDSLNVLTGSVAGYQQRGFIVPAKGAINVDGFRINDDKVKSFQFGSVAASKATKQGLARNVGVVGLAVFEEDEAKATMMLRKEQFQREDASAFPVSGR